MGSIHDSTPRLDDAPAGAVLDVRVNVDAWHWRWSWLTAGAPNCS